MTEARLKEIIRRRDETIRELRRDVHRETFKKLYLKINSLEGEVELYKRNTFQLVKLLKKFETLTGNMDVKDLYNDQIDTEYLRKVVVDENL